MLLGRDKHRCLLAILELLGHGRLWVKLRRTQCEQMSSELPLKADIAQCSRRVRFVPTRDIARLPRERAPRKRGAPGANSQALIGSTRFTPWRVTEARRESRETHAPWACDADLPGFKFLIR
jgi:hypothetical protein